MLFGIDQKANESKFNWWLFDTLLSLHMPHSMYSDGQYKSNKKWEISQLENSKAHLQVFNGLIDMYYIVKKLEWEWFFKKMVA